MTALNPARLAAVLKKVPEKKFRIVSLAPQLLTPEGEVDIEKCMDRHGDILPAIDEVKRYIRDCHSARYNMETVKGGKFEEETWDEEDIEVGEEDGV
jgi:hypothetical protein